MDKEWDIIIIGMGPAGMFAAYKLIKKAPHLKILMIDRGKSVDMRSCTALETGVCVQCPVCDIMCGEGGAGIFSDGTLNLRYDIGGDLSKYATDISEAEELIIEVDEIFLKFGAPSDLANKNNTKKVRELKLKAASAGVRFIDIPQRHIGSDKAPLLLKIFSEEIRSMGVDVRLGTKVEDLIIEKGVCKGVRIKGKDGLEIRSKTVLISPGRGGISWIEKIIDLHPVKASYGGIDVGVRVEVPAIIMDGITSINRDPKFHIRTKTYDDFIRTFCTNCHGFVVKEKYKGFIGVNGHSHKEKESVNTNFAFLVHINLTEPMENTTKYGKSIAKLASTIGGGDPIVQRIGDLKKGRRTTSKRLKRGHVKNTLRSLTPGDISMALPHRIVTDIIEGLDKLDEVIPGVMSDSTLLYAPEIKFYSMKVAVDSNMRTSIRGLYAAGDGAGLSGDIVNASATGLLAARGILNNLNTGT